VPGSDTLHEDPVAFQVAADCTLEIVASAGTAASRTAKKRNFFITHPAKVDALGFSGRNDTDRCEGSAPQRRVQVTKEFSLRRAKPERLRPEGWASE